MREERRGPNGKSNRRGALPPHALGRYVMAMTPPGHVLAIDEGTTGATALVIAADGRIAGRGYREIAQHYPRPGWVEHDPLDILERTLEAAREAVAQAGVTPAAIGITNQRETVVLWDRATGAPVHRAIVWQDRRTAARCAELAPRAAEIAARTGLVLDPYFSATKLEWLLEPGRPRRACHARRARLRHRGRVAHLAAHRRRRARHRPHQCLAHDAVRPRRARVERRSCARSSAWTRRSCRRSARVAGDFGAARGDLIGVRGAIPIARRRGRPAGGALRAGMLARRRGEEHLRHRRLPPDERGRATPRRGERTARRRSAATPRARRCTRWKASIFIAGAAVQWLRDGLGLIASAGEVRGARAVAPVERGRVFRARPRGARRAALGAGGARHDRAASRAAPRARTSRAPPRGDGVSARPMCST